jgi:hypothetical protein
MFKIKLDKKSGTNGSLKIKQLVLDAFTKQFPANADT